MDSDQMSDAYVVVCRNRVLMVDLYDGDGYQTVFKSPFRPRREQAKATVFGTVESAVEAVQNVMDDDPEQVKQELLMLSLPLMKEETRHRDSDYDPLVIQASVVNIRNGSVEATIDFAVQIVKKRDLRWINVHQDDGGKAVRPGRRTRR